MSKKTTKTINEYLSSSENLLETDVELATSWSYNETTDEYSLQMNDGSTRKAVYTDGYITID